MKKLLFIPIAAAVCLFSACKTYQINTISSVNTPLDEKTGKFNIENDSVKITYSFSGFNAPINVVVYNKLNEPVYVDWKRSAYIIDKKATSFSNDAVTINGSYAGTAIKYSAGQAYNSGSIQSTANLPDNIMFVPPHAEVGKTLAQIAPEQNRFIQDSLVKNVKLSDHLSSEDFKAKMAKFNKNNTPLLFKSYITMYVIENNAQKFMSYTNEFYVSETIESGRGPESFSTYPVQRGDTFYSNIKSQWGTVKY